MKATRHYIGFGDPGIEATLRHMRRLVLDSATSPVVIEWAQGVVRFLPERDPDGAARAFLSWVRANVRYTEDPVDVEVIKTPEALLLETRLRGRGAGDCDDEVTLLAAGLNAVGIPTEFIVLAADEMAPNDFSHVLLQYAGSSGWTTVDPIVRGTGLGYIPPRYTRIGYYRDGRLAAPAGSHARRPGVGVGVTVALIGLYALSRVR